MSGWEPSLTLDDVRRDPQDDAEGSEAGCYKLAGVPYGLDNGCFGSFRENDWEALLCEAEINRPLFVDAFTLSSVEVSRTS